MNETKEAAKDVVEEAKTLVSVEYYPGSMFDTRTIVPMVRGLLDLIEQSSHDCDNFKLPTKTRK